MTDKLIFLDFDGVLNSDIYWAENSGVVMLDKPFDIANIKVLNTLIEHTKADIVISSLWRQMMNIQKIRAILWDNGFKYVENIYDMTPFIPELPIRGMEIHAWLLDNPKHRNFVIVDDRDDMGWLNDRLVQINSAEGLTLADANKIIRMLRGEVLCPEERLLALEKK